MILAFLVFGFTGVRFFRTHDFKLVRGVLYKHYFRRSGFSLFSHDGDYA